jgi:hypothetical protein
MNDKSSKSGGAPATARANTLQEDYNINTTKCIQYVYLCGVRCRHEYTGDVCTHTSNVFPPPFSLPDTADHMQILNFNCRRIVRKKRDIYLLQMKLPAGIFGARLLHDALRDLVSLAMRIRPWGLQGSLFAALRRHSRTRYTGSFLPNHKGGLLDEQGFRRAQFSKTWDMNLRFLLGACFRLRNRFLCLCLCLSFFPGTSLHDRDKKNRCPDDDEEEDLRHRGWTVSLRKGRVQYRPTSLQAYRRCVLAIQPCSVLKPGRLAFWHGVAVCMLLYLYVTQQLFLG